MIAMMWNRRPTKILSSKALKSAGIALSNFSTAQPSAGGFFLVGTIHFNPAVLEFDEGRVEFALRRGRVVASGKGCVFEYSSIAYVARVSEEHTLEAETEKTQQRDRAGSAEAQGAAGASLTKGISAHAEAKGEMKRGFADTDVTKLKATSTQTDALIEAFPRATKGRDVNRVEWAVLPDELTPLHSGDGSHSVLHGERMRRGNEDGGLAYVRLAKPEGCVELSLDVRAPDIAWIDISFNIDTPLHKQGKRLVDGRSKRDIVGRIALGKALEGLVALEKLPQE